MKIFRSKRLGRSSEPSSDSTRQAGTTAAHILPEQSPSDPQSIPRNAMMLAPPCSGAPEELARLDAAGEFGSGPATAYEVSFSKFNPTPGA